MSRIIFLNIGWMSEYQGITETDTIIGGGSYDNADKSEIWNFKNINGYCCGYVQPVTNGRDYDEATINLQRIDPSWINANFISGVTVVWVARNPKEKQTYIVGWYKNAMVNRYFQDDIEFDHGYYVKAKAEDCHLVKEEERNFVIPRADKDHKGFLGQSNVWYADKKIEEVMALKAEVLAYIENR